MATNLNWVPHGGIVAHVPPEQIPRIELPPQATTIRMNGKPAFHVTLIGRLVMLPYATALGNLWPGIADTAPPPPTAQLGQELLLGEDKVKHAKSWIVEVLNAAEFRDYVRELAALIDRTLRAADHGRFINEDVGRRFHVTIANDQGGDPMKSPSKAALTQSAATASNRRGM